MKTFLKILTSLAFAFPAVALSQLPEGIAWETNMDDPSIGDPAAVKGGTFVDYTIGYPQSFRIFGPNSNSMFANWNNPQTKDLTLVGLHPTTDNFIPLLATHWSVQPDNKTVYYKLDERARWSDGEKVTADDYLFTVEMMRSPHIRDPFYNQYVEDYIESVEKIDDYTIKVVGTKESWRPLYDYALFPMPEHTIELTETWVDDSNFTPPVVHGAYTIDSWVLNESVTFKRIEDWWGYDHHYFQGVFNVDEYVLKVISDPERALDYFQKGELSFYSFNSSRLWATKSDFEAINNGWASKTEVFLKQPIGLSGIIMNLSKPVFQNKDFRQGLQYLFNFDELNSKLMYNSYYRQTSPFEGTPYANPELSPYPYDPKTGVKHLRAAGFTKRGPDGYLVNDKGEKAEFTLSYGSKSFERHLTVIQNTFKRAGVNMKLQLLERVALFENIREKAYEASMTSMTANFYPAPHQYFSTEFKDKPQTNNFFAFGSEETDKLIDTYRFSMNEQERMDAMHELDRIIQDEAFIIPFWFSPSMRIAYWDYVKFPDSYFPKRTQSHMEYQVFWIDQEKEKEVKAAMKEGKKLSSSNPLVVDPYGVKESLEGN